VPVPPPVAVIHATPVFEVVTGGEGPPKALEPTTDATSLTPYRAPPLTKRRGLYVVLGIAAVVALGIIASMSIPSRDPTPIARPPVPAAPKGTADIRSTPAGAEVKVDGQSHGVTPTQVGDLSPGRHRVELLLAGHERAESTVDVTAGGNAVLEMTLVASAPPPPDPPINPVVPDPPVPPVIRVDPVIPDRPPPPPPERATLSINTVPWSKVYAGNRLLGTTPIEARVPPGVVRLRFVDANGQTHFQTLRLEPGQTANHLFRF